MLILNAKDVQEVLPMRQAIEAVKNAYLAYSTGRAEVPLRSHLAITAHNANALFMPAYVRSPNNDEALSVKIVTLYPDNTLQGLPLIYASVLVLDPNTGKPIALLDGSKLTAIRTGAASGAATEVLSNLDSTILAIIGAGVQGRTQVEAVCAVRPIQTVWIYDTSREKMQACMQDLLANPQIPNDIRMAATSSQAVEQADIICTATTANIPVFEDAWLKPGVHINAVGAYTPLMCEVPSATIARALIVVDSIEACLAEAGDLLQAIEKGVIRKEQIEIEIGEIIAGIKPGRKTNDQITFFKSVGLAVQDALSAWLAVTNANKLSLGQNIPW